MYRIQFFWNNKEKKGFEKMETLHKVCLVFTIIGAINWGLVGLFDFNLVTALFKEGTMLTRLIYDIVGICGLINIMLLFKHYTDDPIK